MTTYPLPHTSLTGKIITVLSKYPNSNAPEIRKLISQKDPFTIQAIYKELRNLRAQEIVTKNGPKFHLRLDWITDLSQFSESLFKKSLEALVPANILPSRNTKKDWYISGLVNVTEFVAEVISLVENQEKARVRFSYKPHQWPYLIGQTRFTELKKRLHVENVKRYMILGTKSPLDTWATKFLKTNTEYSFSESPLHKIRNRHINVIGDYVLTTKLSKKTVRVMEKAYNKYTHEEEIPFAIHAIANGCRLEKFHITLEHSPRKAHVIKNKFRKMFWIKE